MTTSSPPQPRWRRVLAAITGQTIVLAAKLITGLRSQGYADHPAAALTLYFGNHTSHGDFVLIWAALPAAERRRTRPVAGQDYWEASGLRRFIGNDVLHALMIQRNGRDEGAPDPIQQMADALHAGQSLIMFPEGTRNTTDALLLPLKSGLYHLARQHPDVRLIPVWIDNIRRVLPKGASLPVPLACSVAFGAAIALQPGEDKTSFLARARQALLALQPEHDAREDLHANTNTES